ncbi:hypothetical protein [Streptomyces sp. NPDC014806]|uniref:hypothetical protein n=1 Tax=Streptomyces sp. NPDC014806 TaxID=3364920 RepID=UPI0036F9844D
MRARSLRSAARTSWPCPVRRAAYRTGPPLDTDSSARLSSGAQGAKQHPAVLGGFLVFAQGAERLQ